MRSAVESSSRSDRIGINQEHLLHDNGPSDLHIPWKSLSFTSSTFRTECRELMRLGLPMGFSLATRILQYLTDQSMVGHIGTDYLAAASMANIVMTISGTYIYAFCGTINVLCSQALGARNLPLVSEWAVLGCALALVLTAPTFVSYWYCEQILRLFGATPHIASLAGQFARWSMISIVPNWKYVPNQ